MNIIVENKNKIHFSYNIIPSALILFIIPTLHFILLRILRHILLKKYRNFTSAILKKRVKFIYIYIYLYGNINKNIYIYKLLFYSESQYWIFIYHNCQTFTHNFHFFKTKQNTNKKQNIH